jgi:hypothetical protein
MNDNAERWGAMFGIGNGYGAGEVIDPARRPLSLSPVFVALSLLSLFAEGWRSSFGRFRSPATGTQPSCWRWRRVSENLVINDFRVALESAASEASYRRGVGSCSVS